MLFNKQTNKQMNCSAAFRTCNGEKTHSHHVQQNLPLLHIWNNSSLWGSPVAACRCLRMPLRAHRAHRPHGPTCRRWKKQLFTPSSTTQLINTRGCAADDHSTSLNGQKSSSQTSNGRELAACCDTISNADFREKNPKVQYKDIHLHQAGASQFNLLCFSCSSEGVNSAAAWLRSTISDNVAQVSMLHITHFSLPLFFLYLCPPSILPLSFFHRYLSPLLILSLPTTEYRLFTI